MRDIASLTAVIVAYNRKDMVFETLPLLLGCNLMRQIIVVDNASSDNLCVEGSSRFPEVKWIILPENEGCTAWNKGMAQVKSDYALILDDDCIPDIPSLYAATEAMEKDVSTGLAAFNIINKYSGKSEWGPLQKTDGSSGWHNAIGACMLVRTEAFLKAGGYKDFFLCFNDSDLALSLWEAGYKVIYKADWIAFHKQKIIGTKKRKFFFEVRNLLRTIWGHLSIVPGILITVKFVAGAIYDARCLKDYALIIKAFGEGIIKGFAQRGKRRGEIPAHIRALFYKNFLFSSRCPEVFRRIEGRGNE
jgi:GT2 family glycosyltransferase